MVGVRGLEPPTPRPPGECATRLRYTPFLKGLMRASARSHVQNQYIMKAES